MEEEEPPRTVREIEAEQKQLNIKYQSIKALARELRRRQPHELTDYGRSFMRSYIHDLLDLEKTYRALEIERRELLAVAERTESNRQLACFIAEAMRR